MAITLQDTILHRNYLAGQCFTHPFPMAIAMQDSVYTPIPHGDYLTSQHLRYPFRMATGKLRSSGALVAPHRAVAQ
ncbi:hypothetical protein [uncultured Duncaniella sp.]|uniref:hypothetical protein n=2 Tax=uncultured Duncaniella sp. TaxID=2768039 RepID=UPI00260E4DAE|nr:hypothetical protein [uncultured Duncaniella sp.]